MKDNMVFWIGFRCWKEKLGEISLWRVKWFSLKDNKNGNKYEKGGEIEGGGVGRLGGVDGGRLGGGVERGGGNKLRRE